MHGQGRREVGVGSGREEGEGRRASKVIIFFVPSEVETTPTGKQGQSTEVEGRRERERGTGQGEAEADTVH